jgi:hypothetical protein
MTTAPVAARAGRREWVGLGVLALPRILYAMDLTMLWRPFGVIGCPVAEGQRRMPQPVAGSARHGL